MNRWNTFIMDSLSGFELHVDDDFESIYDSSWLEGDFHSCMTNQGYHSFYEDAVEAKAAYLTNESDMIVARCVIYTNVMDADDSEAKPLRLAERQYSSHCDEKLKRALVNKLIEGGHIDGYKRIGADCHDARNFVLNDGTSLKDRHLYIDCNLDWGDNLSYQDSFKHYDMEEGKAYNYDVSSWNTIYGLDTTNGRLEDEDEDEDEMYYAQYQDRDVYEVTDVYYHGNEITCDSDDMDDFIYWNDAYYHADDDLDNCPACGGTMLSPEYYSDELYYSRLTDEYYCCPDCRTAAEQHYKEQEWYQSDITGEYYETREEMTPYLTWNGDDYDEYYVGTDEVDGLVEAGTLVYYYGFYYHECSVNEDGIPFDVAQELEDQKALEEVEEEETVTA